MTPTYVDAGGDLHVDITPEPGYEIAYVEYNGDDVTDLLNEDNSLDITGIDEDVEIVVAFWRIYQVTSGDGGEHTLGSNDDLAFVVDKDPYSYTDDDVLIRVDDEYVDLNNDSVVEPLAQTVTLLSHYLDTLEVGEHLFEILFFNDEGKIAEVARASFTILEAEEGEEETEADVPVPNTGAHTDGGDGASAVGLVAALSGVVIAVIMFTVWKFINRNAKND